MNLVVAPGKQVYSRGTTYAAGDTIDPTAGDYPTGPEIADWLAKGFIIDTTTYTAGQRVGFLSLDPAGKSIKVEFIAGPDGKLT
jgi:hypothetical protein